MEFGKTFATHLLSLKSTGILKLDLYKCVVHGDSGKVGTNDFTTNPVIKENVNGSGDGSGGKYFRFSGFPSGFS